MLRTILLATSATLALITVAQSADLPSRSAPPAFVAAAPTLSWTGFYIGGQVGAVSTRSRLGFDIEGANRSNWTSMSAGVHIGYNHRIGNIVAGVEADANARFGRGKPNLSNAPATPLGWEARAMWDASLRARLGYLVTPNTLVYATGGVAASNFTLKNSDCPACAAWDSANILGGSRYGWTIGAGIEYALSAKWSARIEYRHTDYGSQRTAYDNGKSVRSRLTDDRIALGLSYHFGVAAAPVVAKY